MLNFLRLLHERAKRTAEPSEEILHEITFDVLSVPDLLSNDGSEDEVQTGNQEADTAQQTAISNRFCVFTELVAGYQIGDNTEATVVEATAQTVLEIGHVFDRKCEETRWILTGALLSRISVCL